jgi:hypothetical protein
MGSGSGTEGSLRRRYNGILAELFGCRPVDRLIYVRQHKPQQGIGIAVRVLVHGRQ